MYIYIYIHTHIYIYIYICSAPATRGFPGGLGAHEAGAGTPGLHNIEVWGL